MGRRFKLELSGEIESDGTVKVIGVLSDLVLPDAPESLQTTTLAPNLVRLLWSAGGGAESWDLYRDGVYRASLSVPEYEDSEVDPGGTYLYKVLAKNIVGDSEFSEEIEVTTPSVATPNTPTNLVALNSTAHAVTLEWDLDVEITEWDVSRDSILLDTVETPTYTDNTVTSETVYEYEVVARNGLGDSSPTTLEVTTPVNAPPLWESNGVINANLNSACDIDLSDLCSEGDGHVLTFTVQSGSLPTGVFLVGNRLTGQFTAVGSSTPTIRADDGIDTADLQFTFTVADSDVTAPTAPDTVTAVANGSTVTCSSAGSTDASGISHYRAFRDGAFRQTFTAFPYVESGLAAGAYTFSFTAVDASTNANESSATAANEVTVEAEEVDVPVNFVAIPVSSSRIDLSWEPGPNGPLPSSYLIEMDTVPDPDDSENWDNVDEVTQTSYVLDVGLLPSTTYYFKVKARPAPGQTLSGSAQAQATTQGAESETEPTKIVQPDGAGGAYTTLQAAINDMVAGDIIELRSNTPGTTTVLSEVLTITNKVGTAQSPITIRARVGDTIKLRPNSNQSTIITFTNSNFITFDAQIARALVIGDPDLYNPSLGETAGYTFQQTLNFFGTTSHIWFKKCAISGARGYRSMDASRQAQLICFDECEMEKHSLSAIPESGDGTSGDSKGDGFTGAARRVLLRNCTIKWFGGHNMVSIRSHHGVWCGGKIQGNWKEIIPERSEGYRQAALNAGDIDYWDIKTIDYGVWGPIVMDGVYWDRLGDKNEPVVQGGFKTNTYNLIIRGNLFADALQPPFGGGNFAQGNGSNTKPNPSSGLCRIYNNTVYLAQGLWRMTGSGWTTNMADTVFSDHKFLNNLVELTGDVRGQNEMVTWGYSPMPAAGMNALRNCEFAHNRFDGTSPSGFAMKCSGQNVTTIRENMANLQSNYPTNFHDNTTDNISWANTGSVGARTFTIKPASGEGLGDAAPLTTITANATNATVVQMADASWFVDYANPASFNMGYFGMVGDDVWIGTSIGTAVRRTISAINRTNYNNPSLSDAVTLTEPVTVTSGMSVWWGGNPSSRFQQIYDNKGCGQ